ncbi:50S ribosomal protein L29 [Candidatus Ruminimicrobium bovinum]|uniref:50S ribosomal protein L29 n=1 Tax=Candidatus Ruminimicrobium bovinum TaxID=3242779 RepID=UPI0039B92B99
MKASMIHSMSNDELNTKLDELKEQLLFLRLKHATGQQENPMVMVACKKDIARILTVLREREIAESKKA